MELILPVLLIIALCVWLYRRRQPGMKPFSRSEQSSMSIDDRYNISRQEKEKELDRLLEKINKKGITSLSTKEKERLKQLSQ